MSVLDSTSNESTTAPAAPLTSKLYLIPSKIQKKIDAWLEKFPPDKKKSGILYALKLVQADHQGWLSEAAMQAVARYLELPPIAVYEVATFYSLFELKPVGRHVLSVCTNVSCQLNGCEALMQHLEKKHGLLPKATSPDGRFTLKPVECLAACDQAPMMQVGEKTYANLTPEKLDTILEALP